MGIANKLVWKIYSTAISVAAGLLTAFAVKKAWQLAVGEEPPNASDPDTPAGKAFTWGIASAAAFVAAKLATDRFTERQWAAETGVKPNETKKGHRKANLKLSL